MLKNLADFRDSTFNLYGDFWNSAFYGTTLFRDSSFNGTAYFNKSEFNSSVDFSDSQFNRPAYFRYSTFNSTAYFRSSKFNDIADFGYSSFKDNANFDESKFNKLVFRKSLFKRGLSLNNLDFEEIYLESSAINNISRNFDGKVYLSLIESYKARGFYSDADNCYYTFREEQFFNRKITDDPFMYLFDLGAWVFYGFGKRPLFTLIWSTFFIVLFGGIWMAIGSKRSRREIDEYSQIKKWPDGVLNAFFFSAALFLSDTKLFVDPPTIPELHGVSRSVVYKVFIAERLLGALFSVLFFLAVTGMIIKST